jgi:hypothetical protein
MFCIQVDVRGDNEAVQANRLYERVCATSTHVGSRLHHVTCELPFSRL